MATSTTAAPKHEFLVILPDRENALQRRLEVRPKHFEGLKNTHPPGFCTFGGSTLDEPFTASDATPTPKMNGSVLLANAGSAEEVLEQLKKDVYFTESVWDPEKIQIIPFKCALRTAL